MNILLVHQFFLEEDDPGGSRFNEMAKIWALNGHKVTVISGMLNYLTSKVPEKYQGKEHVREDYLPGLVVHRCRVDESYNSSFLGRLKGYFSFVLNAIKVGKYHAKDHYDVLLVTSPPLFLAITAWRLSRIKKVPFVFEVRDLWPESAIDTGVVSNPVVIKLAYALERFVYSRALAINVLTPAFRDILISKKNVPSEKVFFIPNAADFSLSDEVLNHFNVENLREELRLKDSFVITYVGAHGVANHLVQLLDAAEVLQNENVVFQLIGDGMQKKELVDRANKRSLRNVIFRDPVSKREVFKYILASDIGASVLKKVDTFKTIYSNKTFDYMSCKKPVLLCIDGVSRELVETADCGLYAEPENTKEIVATIRKFMNNRDLVLKQGENGYNYAKANFDREVLALRYVDRLEEYTRIS